MKKKVIIGSIILSLFFFMGGIYIISTIETATSELDNLITLHKVEILREQLLIQLKRVQFDINLKNTRYAKNIDTIISNMENMESAANTCFDCHHSIDIQNRLENLETDIIAYKKAVSRVFTIRANVQRLEAEEDRAYMKGNHLIEQVNNMIGLSSSKLEIKTKISLENIANTKTILYMLVSLGPLSTVIIAVIFVTGFTRPINSLLTATRKLKDGALDYRIEGLKDEFGEVAASFNEMSSSLKQYMHKIAESEKRYRMLFESAGDAIFILDAEGENTGNIISANTAAAEMHGYDINELLELNMLKDIDVAEDAKDAPGRIKRMLNGEWISMEIAHRKKDGTVFPVEVSEGLLEFMDHKYILAFDRDITERKKMENIIQQARHDWEDTFNTITDMITIHDMDFNIIRSNIAAQKVLGLAFLTTTKEKCYEHYHGKSNPPEGCPSCECYETGKSASFEIFEPHMKKFLEVRAMPRFDINKQMIGLIHVVRDITETKNIEESFKRAEQMKIVGEWAAGLVHEIKNSLAGMKISVEVLARTSDFSENSMTSVNNVLAEIKRVELLLKKLLNFAKPPKLQFFLTDINEILDNAIEFSLIQSSLPSNNTEGINIRKDFGDNIPATLADPLQLRQVFMNILINAGEAMQDGGTITLKTYYNEELNFIGVEISDTGKGINKQVMNKMFKPFFTTKTKGTGLGLAISQRIIEDHGGDICVENKPEGGAIFYFDIPVKSKKELRQ